MTASEATNGGDGFRRTPNKQLYDMTEDELVREILFGSTRLYEFFGFVMTDVHGLKAEDGWEYVFFGNIPRTDLGLSRLGQPGDIDLLVIPHQGNKFHLGKAAAIEIKRLALKAPRWNKSTDRLGITQANGLLAAGFPYVGILHLIVHDRGPDENHAPMLAARVLDQEGRMSVEGSSITDMTGYISSERQLGRLLAHNPDPVIGLNCVSLCDVDRPTNRGVMIGMPNGRPAKRNPNASRTCVRQISAFMDRLHTKAS